MTAAAPFQPALPATADRPPGHTAAAPRATGAPRLRRMLAVGPRCPDCGGPLAYGEGCRLCPVCGHSSCA